MKNFILIFCILGITKISSAQTYLPLAGGTLTGILTVNGSSANTARIIITGSDVNGTALYLNPNSTNGRSWGLLSNGVAAQGEFTIYDGTAGLSRLTVNSSGNVGIGTTDPQGYKLAVNGNMIAESVKVKLNGSWPDYVFKNNYTLHTLSEIEKFIQINNHLPGIPSAEQVKKDGLDLGEMNAKLLQKIEELTLHLIEQSKRTDKQDKLNEEQQREINRLKSKL